MKLLFVGDIFGEAGRRVVETVVPQLREERNIDVVIVNGENAARGIGLSIRIAKQLFDMGIDGITLGNHAFRQRDIFPMLNTHDRIIRPFNMSKKSPGKGIMFLEVGKTEIAVINVMGSLFLDVAQGPFEGIDSYIEEARQRTPNVFVDIHAEATSEKVAMGQYLKGKVTAVVGTHTHVQTSDARILDGDTAFITDLGMTGPHDSVIGVRSDIILRKLTTGLGERFEPADSGVQLEGVIIEFDPANGKAVSIEAIRIPE